MTLMGDFAKGLVIVTVVLWIISIIDLLATGQTGVAILLIIGFIPPLFMIAYEYYKNRKK